jgi:hypothetical protein
LDEEEAGMTDNSQQAFEDKLRNLISDETNGGATTGYIHRQQVEEVGEASGLSAVEACTRFFAYRGSIWDLATSRLEDSMMGVEELDLPPPRNWALINDIYLIT